MRLRRSAATAHAGAPLVGAAPGTVTRGHVLGRSNSYQNALQQGDAGGGAAPPSAAPSAARWRSSAAHGMPAGSGAPDGLGSLLLMQPQPSRLQCIHEVASDDADAHNRSSFLDDSMTSSGGGGTAAAAAPDTAATHPSEEPLSSRAGRGGETRAGHAMMSRTRFAGSGGGVGVSRMPDMASPPGDADDVVLLQVGRRWLREGQRSVVCSLARAASLQSEIVPSAAALAAAAGGAGRLPRPPSRFEPSRGRTPSPWVAIPSQPLFGPPGVGSGAPGATAAHARRTSTPVLAAAAAADALHHARAEPVAPFTAVRPTLRRSRGGSAAGLAGSSDAINAPRTAPPAAPIASRFARFAAAAGLDSASPSLDILSDDGDAPTQQQPQQPQLAPVQPVALFGHPAPEPPTSSSVVPSSTGKRASSGAGVAVYSDLRSLGGGSGADSGLRVARALDFCSGAVVDDGPDDDEDDRPEALRGGGVAGGWPARSPGGRGSSTAPPSSSPPIQASSFAPPTFTLPWLTGGGVATPAPLLSSRVVFSSFVEAAPPSAGGAALMPDAAAMGAAPLDVPRAAAAATDMSDATSDGAMGGASFVGALGDLNLSAASFSGAAPGSQGDGDGSSAGATPAAALPLAAVARGHGAGLALRRSHRNSGRTISGVAPAVSAASSCLMDLGALHSSMPSASPVRAARRRRDEEPADDDASGAAAAAAGPFAASMAGSRRRPGGGSGDDGGPPVLRADVPPPATRLRQQQQAAAVAVQQPAGSSPGPKAPSRHHPAQRSRALPGAPRKAAGGGGAAAPHHKAKGGLLLAEIADDFSASGCSGLSERLEEAAADFTPSSSLHSTPSRDTSAISAGRRGGGGDYVAHHLTLRSAAVAAAAGMRDGTDPGAGEACGGRDSSSPELPPLPGPPPHKRVNLGPWGGAW